jgi:predicted branched-subunit amino acid permease
MTDQAAISSETSSARWFLRGMRAVVSVPAFILLFSFIGFGALCRESGLTVWAAALTTASLWALPGQVVLVGSMAAGVGFLATAIAVGLSAVRLLPMTVSLVPVLRAPGIARWKLFFASYFIAVTAWVVAMQRLPSLPREARFPFFAGFTVTLASSGTVVTAASFLLAANLPTLLSAGLVFLTPIYFLSSLFAAARLRSDRLALGLGILAWPLFDWLLPAYALLLTGAVAGTGAYLVHRLTAEPAPAIEPTEATEP